MRGAQRDDCGMTGTGGSHYGILLKRHVAKGLLDPEMSVLVLCGDTADKEALQEAGFRRCVISNLDERHDASTFSPFEWSFQDAEKLTFDDGAFDLVIVHEGLHHCYSPHRAILEMFRVARRGVMLVEPANTLLTRVTKSSALAKTTSTPPSTATACNMAGSGTPALRITSTALRQMRSQAP